MAHTRRAPHQPSRPPTCVNYLHCELSTAPCCSSIFVIERLLLSTATSSGDRPSLFRLERGGATNQYAVCTRAPCGQSQAANPGELANLIHCSVRTCSRRRPSILEWCAPCPGDRSRQQQKELWQRAAEWRRSAWQGHNNEKVVEGLVIVRQNKLNNNPTQKKRVGSLAVNMFLMKTFPTEWVRVALT